MSNFCPDQGRTRVCGPPKRDRKAYACTPQPETRGACYIAVSLELKLKRDIPWFLTSEAAIEQVIINLLSNAMNALDRLDKEDKWVRVKTNSLNNICSIEISDNGPGIPDEVKEHIFDPLFTTENNFESMGLGLSIVQHLLERIDRELRQ